MKIEPLVSIIIVNWNGGEILKDCLKSLFGIKYHNWELIVVDNGSIDGSQNLKYKFQLIQNKSNLGFAEANNQGYKISHGKYILLLNNDTKVESDFLNVLVEKMKSDSTIGVIQPKIRIMDKPTYLDNVGSFLTRLGFLQHIGYMEMDNKKYDKEMITFSTKGACMMIRRKLIEKLGLFDNDFGSYFEETDFCWRVWMSGFKIIYYPKAFIYHKVGFSSKRQKQIFVFYHSLKNRLISMIKNLEVKNLITIGGIQILFIIGLSMFYLLRLQVDKFFMIWKAIGWNLKNLNRTLQKRKSIQSLRKKTDQEIFTYILKPVDWKGMLSHFLKVEANFK